MHLSAVKLRYSVQFSGRVVDEINTARTEHAGYTLDMVPIYGQLFVRITYGGATRLTPISNAYDITTSEPISDAGAAANSARPNKSGKPNR